MWDLVLKGRAALDEDPRIGGIVCFAARIAKCGIGTLRADGEAARTNAAWPRRDIASG